MKAAPDVAIQRLFRSGVGDPQRHCWAGARVSSTAPENATDLLAYDGALSQPRFVHVVADAVNKPYRTTWNVGAVRGRWSTALTTQAAGDRQINLVGVLRTPVRTSSPLLLCAQGSQAATDQVDCSLN